MPQKMDLWHSGLALAKSGPALTTIGLVTGFLVAYTTSMPNPAFEPLPMPQKMDLWYSRMAQILLRHPRRYWDFAIGFLMIRNPYYSNFMSKVSIY